MIEKILLPNKAIISITKNIAGNDRNKSVSLLKNEFTIPPFSTAMNANVIPKINDTKTAPNPTNKEILDPYTILVNTSLPNSSEPNRNNLDLITGFIIKTYQ